MAGKAKAKDVTATKTRTSVRKIKETIPSVEFKLLAPEAKQVFLTGDFNNWEGSSEAYRMRKNKDNVWRKKVKLQPGRYEYQFVVDGQWWTDPENPERQANPYCTENSVLTVQ